MSAAMHFVRVLLDGLLAPLDWVSPAAGLTVLAVLSGVLMLLVLRRTTNQRALRRARDRMVAAVYEVRLFLDSPRRVAWAQLRLLGWSARYVAWMLPAFAVLAVPLALLYPRLEVRYGLAPLAPGRPALVEVALAPGADGQTVAHEGKQAGLAVTAPPLFVRDEGRVYLRVEPTRAGTPELRLRVGERVVKKRIAADPAARVVSAERRTGLADAWAFGAEDALPADAGVERIAVAHPAAARRFLAMPWWLYWLAVVMATAFLLRKPLRVEI